MQYSVVIPWADRPELEIALCRNRALLERHDVETIVVNAGGDPKGLETMMARATVRRVRGVHLSGASFNRSLCLNIGGLVSRTDYLFLVDADIILASDLFAEALDDLASGGRFVAVRSVHESHPAAAGPPRANGNADATAGNRPNWSFLAERIQTTEMVTTDGRRAVLRNRMAPGRLRQGDGLVLVRRTDLVRVGGLNSRLVGWGYEDTDFQTRLQFAGIERVELGEVIHLTHPAAGRDMLAWRRNFHASTENYSRGDYLGSLDEDALQWRAALADVDT